MKTVCLTLLLFEFILLQILAKCNSVQYLAVVQGCHKLAGSQGQLWPLVEVNSTPHMVKMLKKEDWHCSKKGKLYR